MKRKRLGYLQGGAFGSKVLLMHLEPASPRGLVHRRSTNVLRPLIGWANLTHWLSLPGDHERLALLDELHDPTPPAPSLALAHDQLHSIPQRTVDYRISSLLAGKLSAKLCRV